MKMTPESYNKLLGNIRKAQQRSKKKKAQKDTENGEESEEEVRPKTER